MEKLGEGSGGVGVGVGVQGALKDVAVPFVIQPSAKISLDPTRPAACASSKLVDSAERMEGVPGSSLHANIAAHTTQR